MDKELKDYHERRISKLELHFETLNREMGEILGAVNTIKWLVGGGLLTYIVLQVIGMV